MIVMVLMLVPFLASPVAVTIPVSVAVPPLLNNDGCHDNRGRYADIDVYIDGVGHAGYANSKARDQRCQERIFHTVLRS
ncbi:hypothetical protein R69888_06277 [Paraburkholderia haematera]|uniref:Secreted peptide n=1 Tax=Paraburkholderia haematera TaxID=2793077 RepID=A0ABM8SPR0_9BURK|nr:hypothetical protein R69888_06277 [Paraburkholderia haematera]